MIVLAMKNMSIQILKSITVAICIAIAMPVASAQCPETAPLNITATLYTQENGLTSNMLLGTAKDSIGFVYFLGLDGKWIRFDGTNFRAMSSINTIPFYNYAVMGYVSDFYTQQFIGNSIYKTENKSGNAVSKTIRRWGISGDSLRCFDIEKNKILIAPIPDAFGPVSGYTIFPDGDNCWLASSNILLRFNIHSKKFQTIPLQSVAGVKTSSSQIEIIPSRNQSLAYLIVGNTILKLNNVKDTFEKFCMLSPLQRSDALYTLVMENCFFVARSNTKIDEVNLLTGIVNTFDITAYTTIKNSAALKIISLLNYRNYLLIGTSNAGLFIYNRCTRTMQHFQYGKQNSDDALTNSIVWLTVFNDNLIWMQTDAGLIKLEVNNQLMKTYLPSTLKPGGVCNNCNNVRAIYSNGKDELIVGSFEGTYTYNLQSGQFGNLFSPKDNPVNWEHFAAGAITGDGNGNVFIASWINEGMLLLNNEKKKLINILAQSDHPEFSYRNIRCLFFDSRKVLWVGTNEGFLRITNLEEFQKNNFTGKLNVSNKFPGKENRIANNPGDCFTISEDKKGNIWIGTINGLYVYNYKSNAVIQYENIPDDGKSLSDNDVRSVYVANDGDVWIGTNSGGLNHFDNVTKSFTAFTTDNGLPNNSIYTMLEDKNGFLWLGTNAGLCRFNKKDHSVRSYLPRDGIQNIEFNTNAVSVTTDGRFCFGGRTGFNIFHPDSINSKLSAAPNAVITQLKIFDKEYKVTDALLELNHEQNSLTFDFTALNYYRSNDNQFAYMMEGADQDWIKSGKRQYTSYTNLPPGKYLFKVKTANYSGVWSNEIASFQFIIKPAWYNTWWFRTIAILLLTVSIYVMYHYRMKQMMKLHTLRNRIASDLHDEIGSTLGSISLSSALIQSKLNSGNTDVMKLLVQVSNNSSNMMEALSDIVWAINSRNDRFDNVLNRMRAFAIEMLEPSNTGILFNVSEGSQHIQLDMQQRKNLFLIFKEAINNIVKYAGCKNVIITISHQGNKIFVMDIKDDGNGFDITNPHLEEKSLSGNGIRNMKKRAEEFGGTLLIKSSIGGGTALYLRFKI